MNNQRKNEIKHMEIKRQNTEVGTTSQMDRDQHDQEPIPNSSSYGFSRIIEVFRRKGTNLSGCTRMQRIQRPTRNKTQYSPTNRLDQSKKQTFSHQPAHKFVEENMALKLN